METVDLANNAILVDNPSGFIVGSGPSVRLVVRPRIAGYGFDSESSLTGGQSGVPGSPFRVNLLETWLTNETRPLRQSTEESQGEGEQIADQPVTPRTVAMSGHND